jgi:hypothetical protein
MPESSLFWVAVMAGATMLGLAIYGALLPPENGSD